MKKSIASLALLVSATATTHAMPAFSPHEPQKVCLNLSTGSVVVETDQSLSKYGICDETQNNVAQNKEILANGCASGQVALNVRMAQKFDACAAPMPPGVAQL